MTRLTILVTDTNIWIDLEIGGMLERIFELPYEFMVPDIARSEFKKQVHWDQIQKLGVLEGELDGLQVAELIDIRRESPGLSATDVAAFLLARDLSAILVTGEERLRKLATKNNVRVHGVLWLMDEMIDAKILTKQQAYQSLASILSQNPRLPKEECQNRLARWSE